MGHYYVHFAFLFTLKDRNQRVRVGNFYSEPDQVTSGILGPILFIIFMNDLPDCVSSCCKTI